MFVCFLSCYVPNAAQKVLSGHDDDNVDDDDDDVRMLNQLCCVGVSSEVHDIWASTATALHIMLAFALTHR